MKFLLLLAGLTMTLGAVIQEDLEARLAEKFAKRLVDELTLELKVRDVVDLEVPLDEWVRTVFAGVNPFRIPEADRFGKLLLFGGSAFPLLMDPASGAVGGALAQLGQGRIALVSQNEFLRTFPESSGNADLDKLIQNLKTWLSRDMYSGEDDLCVLYNKKSMNNCMPKLDNLKILVLPVFGKKPEEYMSPDVQAEVVEWVRNGGSMLISQNTWLWMNQNPGKPLTDAGFYNMFLEAGIAWTDDMHKMEDGENLWIPSDADIDTLKRGNINYAMQALQGKKDIQLAIQIADFAQSLPPELAQKVIPGMEAYTRTLEAEVQFPQPDAPVDVDEEDMATLLFLNRLGDQGFWKKKAPNMEQWPGDVSSGAVPVTKTIEVTARHPQKDYATGVYLPAGWEATIVVEDTGDDSWMNFQLFIGVHTDTLDKWEKHSPLMRWPSLTKQVALNERRLKVSHWMGGLISLRTNSYSNNEKIKITISNVVEAPVLDTQNPATVANWERTRDSAAPWGDFYGRFIRITVPTSSLAGIPAQQVVDAMDFWDSVVADSNNFFGVHWERRQFVWFAADIQIGGGLMHSGYPICTHMTQMDPTSPDSFVLKYPQNMGSENPGWGYFHELGHNLVKKWLSLDPWGTGEVTNNVLALYNQNTKAGKPLWNIYKLQQFIASKNTRALLEGTGGWDKRPGLVMYAQLARDFGWDCFHQVLKSYEDELGECTPEFPKSQKERRDQMVIRWSKAVGVNVAPIFEFFMEHKRIESADDVPDTSPVDDTYDPEDDEEDAQIQQQELDAEECEDPCGGCGGPSREDAAETMYNTPAFSDKVTTELAGLLPYLPDDQVTQMASARPLVRYLEHKYPSLVRSVPQQPVCTPIPTTEQYEAMSKRDNKESIEYNIHGDMLEKDLLSLIKKLLE